MSGALSDYNSNYNKNSTVSRLNVYSDLNLSLVVNPITKDISPITDIDAVKNSIKNLVLTNFQDRPFHPTYGSGLTALLFEPADIFTIIQIKNAIEKAINNHEPRATDVVIRVNDSSAENGYQVSVGFRVFYDSTLNEVDFFLTRLR